jgi:hypothetical protein
MFCAEDSRSHWQESAISSNPDLDLPLNTVSQQGTEQVPPLRLAVDGRHLKAMSVLKNVSDILGYTSIACWLGAQFPYVATTERILCIVRVRCILLQAGTGEHPEPVH